MRTSSGLLWIITRNWIRGPLERESLTLTRQYGPLTCETFERRIFLQVPECSIHDAYYCCRIIVIHWVKHINPIAKQKLRSRVEAL